MNRLGVTIAGMRYSDTSALADVLGHGGLALPKPLTPPNIGNEMGHREFQPLCDLNDQLLMRRDLDWIISQSAAIKLVAQSVYALLDAIWRASIGAAPLLDGLVEATEMRRELADACHAGI